MGRLTCPKCQCSLQQQTLVGVELDCCPSCSGVWLDKGELTELTRSRGGDALQVSVSKKKRTDNWCPRCVPPVFLFEGEHSHRGEFALDICENCGGLWFDRGEFPRLLKTEG